MGSNDCCCGRWNTAQGTRLIGIASAVISAVASIAFMARLIQLSVAELPAPGLSDSLGNLAGDTQSPARSDKDVSEFVRSQISTGKIISGVMFGVMSMSCIVALLLIVAAKKNNRHMALPFMIWTIACAAGAGMFGVSIVIAYPALRAAHLEYAGVESTNTHLVLDLLLPFVFIVVMFKLYTWWLIVVFHFYNRLKYAVDGPAFDSIPMQD